MTMTDPAGMNGTDLLLLINTGTPAVPVYTVVGAQRDATFDETNEEVDLSSKDQREWRGLAGRYSSTISMDAVYVPDDASYMALQTAMRDGENILAAKQVDGVVTETANCIVTGLSEGFPDQDAATVSISLRVDGEWVEVGT